MATPPFSLMNPTTGMPLVPLRAFAKITECCGIARRAWPLRGRSKNIEQGQAAPPDLRETQKPFVTARAEIKIFATKIGNCGRRSPPARAP